MKRLPFFIALLCTVTLSSSSTPSAANTVNAAKKERAVTKFSQPSQLRGVTLNGQYLFVHSDEAMMRGEACTYVYAGDAEIPNKLVVSFHCTPVARAKAAKFTVRTLVIWPGRYEIREFQFGGSTEAHLVPATAPAAHVNIVAVE
jgi:hypothetical protein